MVVHRGRLLNWTQCGSVGPVVEFSSRSKITEGKGVMPNGKGMFLEATAMADALSVARSSNGE